MGTAGTRVDPSRAQSVQRALKVLEILAGTGRDAGIADLSRRAGLPVSTMHRMLATLVDSGFVTQSRETGRYRIGIRAFEVGNAFREQTRLHEIAPPSMRHLKEQSGETVNLALRDGDDAVYIDQVECDHRLKIFTRPGARVPLYCSGVGKVLLASLDADEADAVLARSAMHARSTQPPVTIELLRQRIALVRDRGFAIDDDEAEHGVRCVAAPIRDHRDETIAALSISGPTARLSDTRLPHLVVLVRQTAEIISKQLGCHATG
jgi:IclR family acetate operon transcriptional repressor